MKVCGSCKQEKSLDQFYWKNRGLGKRQSECKTCKKAYRDLWYAKNRKRHITNVGKSTKINRQEIREKLYDYMLRHPCVDCGESDPVVLEFDHQYGKKSMVSRLHSWAAMLKEIRKCVVRCANCHRRRTAIQLGWYKGLVTKGLVTRSAE